MGDGELFTGVSEWTSPKSPNFTSLAPAALAEKVDVSFWDGMRQKSCIRASVRLAQSCFQLIKRWSLQHECFLQCRASANQVFVRQWKFHENVTLFLVNPAENRIQLLWNKYFIFDTVKKNIIEVAQFFIARACCARLEALYIILFPMGGTTMQASTSSWFLWGCKKVGTFEIYVLSIPNARNRVFV